MIVHVVFTHYNGSYYIEEVTPVNMELLKKNWYVAKVIDETEFYSKFEEVAEELRNPTIPDNHQFIVIQELSE